MCLVHLTFKVSGLARLCAESARAQGYASALDDATYHLLPINTGNSTRISSRALDPPGISDFSFPISNRAKTTCRPFSAQPHEPALRTTFIYLAVIVPKPAAAAFSMCSPSFGCWYWDCGIRHVINASDTGENMRQSVEETEFAPWEIW